ncbi:F-box protein At5g03100-like [Lolium perenne]|uniref:F-box protein At5g03100-like n=1 Tax=Lolium perenne TaxID=4522 RepID=UPI0021F61E77|nr:F-box protein At5g03100-like [Lolium perenne]
MLPEPQAAARIYQKMSGGDLFDALPDELLNHVLSFLPSREAVNSSLVFRRWRHLWRSTPAIRVRGKGNDFRFFVNSLIVHRDTLPLHSFDIDADGLVIQPDPPYNDPDYEYEGWRGEVDRHMDLWVSYALSADRRARLLKVRLEDDWVPWLPRSDLAFASLHLTTVHLDAVCLFDGLLDFSRCPALQSLALVRCRLRGDTLASASLERLALVQCQSDETMFFDTDCSDERLCIGVSTPRLRLMEISEYYEQEQFLEMMPWLTEDNIRCFS